MNNKKKKMQKKEEKKGYIEIEFNLSATIIKIVVICIIIGVITGATVITTVMEAKKTDVLASTEETSSRVTWVDSTELDENGNAKQVPVPKGFTASQIEGETTVSGGFVIYEGDVDWSQIIVDSGEEEITETETQAETATQTETQTETETETDTETQTETETDTEIQTETETETQTETKTETEQNNKNIPTDEPTTIEETQIINEPTTIDDTTKTEEETTSTEEIAAIAETETTEETTTEETTPVATQTEINIFNLQKSTNQYVWVPIEDPSEIYGVDANGKLWGKLYNFSSSGRTANNWSETNGIMSIKSATSYREPDVIANMTEYDIDSKLPQYASGQTRYELLAKEMEQNFYEMIKSIKKYGGFYIGRYETGGLNGTAVVRKMDTNISNQTWYAMYNKCKQLGDSNDNISTSMIWNSLWDATLEWFVDSGATNLSGTQLTYSLVGSNSTTWGNYNNATFDYIIPTAITPVETTTKAINTSTRIPTGSAEYTKVNNIYDIAGNVYDRTLEAYSTLSRVSRGGNYRNNGGIYPAEYRYYSDPTYSSVSVGCRVSLWIK